MKNFLKYYWLEQEYLEKEVRASFKDKGYLTAEQFFAIVKWKRAGNTTLIKRTLKGASSKISRENLEKRVKEITESLAERESGHREKLKVLLTSKGIKLAMASAILTVLYPNNFTVFDWRVRTQLKHHPDCKGNEYPDITYSRKVIEKYFDEYIPRVLSLGRSISRNQKLSLRDCDRLLWAKSWWESMQDFLNND